MRLFQVMVFSFFVMVSWVDAAIKYAAPGNGTGFATTQDGTSENPYRGMYGVQKAIDVAAAADSAFVKSPSDSQNIARYVLFTGVTADKSPTWQVGDTLQNHVGDGDEWVGLLDVATSNTLRIKMLRGTIFRVVVLDSIQRRDGTDSVGFTAVTLSAFVNVNTLVSLTGVSEDKTGTWTVGDSVQCHVGDGNDWTGILCEIVAATILVECRTGEYANIATADSLANVTRTDSVAFTGRTLPGITDDRAVGTITAPLYIYGTNSSWTIGTNVVFFGGHSPDIPVMFTTSVNYRQYAFLSFLGATGNCWRNTSTYLTALHCEASGAGANGVSNNGARCAFDFCKFSDNDSIGLYGFLGNCDAFNCLSTGNALDGFYVTQRPSTFTSCVSARNTRDGWKYASNGYETVIEFSVSAYNGGNGVNTDATLGRVMFSRLVGNGAYGIRCASATDYMVEQYNGFHSNSSGQLYNHVAGYGHFTEAAANGGLANPAVGDYGTATGATNRRIGINLNW